MTKKNQKKSAAPAQNLLGTKIIDLMTDASAHLPYVRRALGEKASEAEVLKEAERRAVAARETLNKLEKPLGTASRPFPMWGTQRDAKSGDLVQALSFIASDVMPMQVYSDRDYNQVAALAYCDMPVPSMLPLFFDGLERRRPESWNRAQFLIGNPGHGKSFMGALQSRLRSKKSAEVYDCGGKNMNDLLFEMVLDFGAADALPMAIDKRLQAGALQALSYGKLKSLPSKALTIGDDGEIKSIDWNYFKGAATATETDKAFTILKEVSAIEGLDNASGNALGMNSQYGPLIRWFIEGREGVLDEYNKSRDGTDNALQTVWQFINGEIPECTVENTLKNKDATSGPSSFTFRREDMAVGFFVTLTGNKTEDGTTTRSLNKSVYSRLSPQTLPDPDVLDWQHRISQMMVGLPVSTLYAVFQQQADKDPAAFGEWLMSLRRAKAEMDGVPVPEIQEALLNNWKDVVNATEKLAKFYEKWTLLTDAEQIASASPDLIEEVDEEYTKKEGVDFRKVKQHLDEAAVIRPRMEAAETPAFVDLKDFFKAPAPVEKTEENPALFFGTRLVEYLERLVYEKTEAVGKPRLYMKLRKAMDEFGLRDISLQDAARSNQKSVESALNISSFDDRDLSKQAKLAHKTFCAYLREIDPEITAEDEDIITVKKVRDALEHVSRAQGSLFFVNRDHETLNAQPILEAKIEDLAVYAASNTNAELSYEDLVHHDDFMAALALPTVSANNLSSIWDANLRPLMDEPVANDNVVPEPGQEEALAMTENKSAHKLAITTLRVLFNEKGEDTDVSVHVVRNEVTNKTLIVGEKIPSKLVQAFREAGITHVDRKDRNAITKIETALSELTRNLPGTVHNRLTEAFKYRNDVLEDPGAPTVGLATLLASSDIDPMYGKYVLKAKGL